MRFALSALSLAPRGFVVEGVDTDPAGALITVRPTSKSGQCPGCGAVSSQIHSRYRRQLADLPIANQPTRLDGAARPLDPTEWRIVELGRAGLISGSRIITPQIPHYMEISTRS